MPNTKRPTEDKQIKESTKEQTIKEHILTDNQNNSTATIITTLQTNKNKQGNPNS